MNWTPEQVEQIAREIDPDFFTITDEYLKSSENLLSACSLVGDDEIKMEMLAEFHDEFDRNWAQDMALRPFVERTDFRQTKTFILDEMKDLTKKNNVLAEKIRNKLKDLPN